MIQFILTRFIPYVMFPVAVVVGTIGYNLESLVSDKRTPGDENSVQEKRDSRILEQMESSDPTKVERLTPIGVDAKGSVFAKNTSPSLLERS